MTDQRNPSDVRVLVACEEVWKWTKVVLFTPVAIAIVVVTAPILGAFAAYDWVFLGQGSRR